MPLCIGRADKLPQVWEPFRQALRGLGLRGMLRGSEVVPFDGRRAMTELELTDLATVGIEERSETWTRVTEI